MGLYRTELLTFRFRGGSCVLLGLLRSCCFGRFVGGFRLALGNWLLVLLDNGFFLFGGLHR